MTESPQYSWVCPECSRKVPNRFDQCRCGAARPDVEILPEGARDDTAPEALVPGRFSQASIVVGGLFLAGVIAFLVLRSGSTVASKTADQPVASAFAPTEPAELRRPSTGSGRAEGVEGRDAPDRPLAPTAPPSEPGGATVGTPDTPSASLEDMVSRAIPAIVSIDTGTGRGSGFFAAPRTVITNRHVIENHVSVMVKLSNGQSLPGRVERSSQEYDLAVVRVDSAPPSHPMLPLGSVTTVRPGQEVIAIGLALGVFQNSVTRGIISAVRRAERTVILQTDAAINPGNSGGPLLNREGQVVGINTLKVTGAAESLGFAVAVDHAQSLLTGTRPTAPLVASAAQSQPLTPAFGGRSSIDVAREQGTQRYAQIVEAAARQAARLDSYWNRIKANCTVRIAPGYDREWFGLWDGRTTLTSPDSSCGSAMSDLEALSAEVRRVMADAQEEGRRASVLPGQLRDIRRRYRMDWVGFDR